ncbi:DUF2946 family protein [Azospirillum sp. HJ39]|uniref:DUF2946 family protein n=1 Tax=Azospirillum sp. HJ39 TaxID=3159496 RepID=UPI003556DC6C
MTALLDFLRLRIGVLCCLALLTGQALTAALLPPPAARTPLFAEGLLDDRIVICTAAGLVIIDRRTGEPVAATEPTDEGRSGNRHDGDHAGAFCLFCLPILHGATHMPAPVELPVPGAGAVRCETPAAPATLPAGRPAGSAWPRGPPTPLPL